MNKNESLGDYNLPECSYYPLLQTMFLRATIEPHCKSIFLQQYMLSIYYKKRKQPCSSHILNSILTTSLLQSDFCFCTSTCLQGKFVINLPSLFSKNLIFKISKNKRGEFIPDSMKVNMWFQVNHTWTTTKEYWEGRIKMSLLRKKHQTIQMLSISCSIRTVRVEFQNSGNLCLLQTLMKRSSNTDYSTCIIVLTSL